MTAADLDALLADLLQLSLESLRAQWRERLGGAPPPLQSRDLLLRALADRLQEQEFGADPLLEQILAPELKRLRPGRKPQQARPRYRPGTLIEKEWQGSTQRVEVLSEGYRWNGQTFGSLSAAARAITGVRWNGPRFFGLRATLAMQK